MKAFAKLTTILTLLAVLATTVFAQAPMTKTAPKTGATVKGYTRKTKSGKVITVKGYTRGKTSPTMPGKMMNVKGYTRKTKTGKMVTVKGYTRKAPMTKGKTAPKM